MSLLSHREILGDVMIPRARRKRVVRQVGLHLEGADAKKLATRRKNERAAARRAADPERQAARAAYQAAWRAKNAEKLKAARERWKEQNPERHRAYQAQWRRAHYVRRGYLYGEKATSAKLTEAQVRELRAIYAAGGISMKAVAARFNISHTAARNVIRGVTWGWLT